MQVSCCSALVHISMALPKQQPCICALTSATSAQQHMPVQVEVFCYALSPSDGSEWRQRIAAETEHFQDVSAWGVPDIARKISADGIQVCRCHASAAIMPRGTNPPPVRKG